MGVTLSKQQVDKLKHEKVDLQQLHLMVQNVKTEDDIEQAIKQYLSIMTIKEKIGQLFQMSCGDPDIPQDVINTII